MNPGESGTNVYLGNRETPGGFPPAPEPIYGSAPSSPDLQNSGIDKEQAMDIFFQVQGAWTHRDLRPVQNLVTAEVAQYFQEQINQLKVTQRINRLENIAVRQAEVVEAWTENGQDFATVHFLANLLDYTEDESSHQIVEGDSKTPVKFEEYWTFTKLQGEPSWRLSGVEQV